MGLHQPGGLHLTLLLRESLDNCRCWKSDRPDKSDVLAGVSHNFLHLAILPKQERIKKGRFHSFTSQFQASLVRRSSDGEKGFTTHGAEGEWIGNRPI